MHYVDKINEALSYVDSEKLTDKVPYSIVEDALSLRNSEPLEGVDYLTDMSDEDRRLFQARFIGGVSSRLALGSYIAFKAGEDVEYLPDLSYADQKEISLDVANRYVGLHDVFVSAADKDPLSYLPHKDVRRLIASTKKAQLSTAERLKNFGHYLNTTPGSFPARSWQPHSTELNDVVLTQAFGRNDIPDKDLPEVEKKRSELGSDEEMFEYLSSIGFDAGASNEALADALIEKLEDETQVLEQISQWEVVYSLWKKRPDLYRKYQKYIHTLWPRGNFYPTFAVKADSVKIMDEVGLYNPIEFAHPDMMVRAAAILGKLGVQADIMRADIPFDPRSVQKQVRGEFPWMVRETLTRVEHLIRPVDGGIGRVSF
jgi:hypothetical protein